MFALFFVLFSSLGMADQTVSSHAEFLKSFPTLTLKSGERVSIDEKPSGPVSTEEGVSYRWRKILRLEASGFLTIRRKGRLTSITLEMIEPKEARASDPDRVLIPLKEESARVPLAAGTYYLSADELLEGEEETTDFPISIPLTLTLSPFNDPELAMRVERLAKRLHKISPTPEKQTVRLTFSALHHESTISTVLSKDALVVVTPKASSVPNFQWQLWAGANELQSPSTKPHYVYAKEGDFKILVSPKLPSEVALDQVVETSVDLNVYPLSESQLFSLVGPPRAVTLGEPLVFQFKLRHTFPVDLVKAKIFFGWHADSAQKKMYERSTPKTPPGYFPGFNSDELFGWVETIALWKRGEERSFDYGTLFRRSYAAHSYGMDAYLLSVEGVSLHGASGTQTSLKLVDVASEPADSREYEEEIKIPMWRKCYASPQSYGGSFDACQEIWLAQHRACRKLFKTDKDFMQCVRDRLNVLAPGLLPTK